MNVQRWMSRQYFSFFLTWGIFLPYWTGWMINTKGITISEVGLIMSIGLIARGFSTLFFFPLSSSRYSSKTVINGAAVGTLITLLLCILANSFTSLLVLTLLLHIFYPILMPALDSAAGILARNKQLRDYGKSRLWGSIAFVVAGLILTVFTESFGDEMILLSMLVGIIAFIVIGFMRTPKLLLEKPKPERGKQNSMLGLFRIKHFGLVLIIVILLQAAHASYYNYGYIYLQEIAVPGYLIGVIINIAVVAEIIFFAIADKKFNKFSVGSLLMLAGMGSTLRWILVFSFPSIIIFSISQVLHACSFAMAHYAFMKFLIKNVPNSLVPKAQGIYSALALSWSTAVFTTLGGYLYEMEPRYAFIGMVISTIPALILAIFYRNLQVKQKAIIAT
ncbi:MFS transporter [Aquibacillus kalidii]|uniref:MFS transporter n=1 Tax=Aquibacillus kalidii TaxID=2762597 RepID=UPI00164831DF|nr:MFS transporter [Aquibacillus kalidii]